MSSLANVLEIENLRHSYSGGSAVLDIPDFQVRKGEMLFLHGPSGSGKTTLLSLITGILHVQTGRLTVLGETMNALSTSRRDALRGSRMGYIFQVFNLLPFLSVMDNILLPLQMSPVKNARFANLAAAQNAATQLAEQLNIAHLLDRRADALSVGQQQRVAAARALIGEPELIVADEPTSALDSDLRETFVKTLFEQARRQNASVLFVSHDKSLMPLFDRSLALADINLVLKGNSK